MHVTRRGTQSGFTLIEIMVVMAIIAMLAAMVGPRLIRQQEKAAVKAAHAQVEQLGTALDTFRLDMGRYPNGQEGLAALMQSPSGAPRWDGPYLNKNVPFDPWDNAYQYRAPGGSGRPYDLYSFGADGAQGGDGDGTDIGNW